MKIQISPYFKMGLLGLSLTLFSCKDYLDINTDPTRNQTPTLSTLLTAAIESTSQNTYNAGFNHSQITQYMAGAAAGGPDTHSEIRLSGVWTGVYLNAMSNLKDLESRAKAASAPHYVGVSQVLQAYNMLLAADAWGDVPYREAFNIANIYPAYDPQEAVYSEINGLLTAAVSSLGQPAGVLSIGTDDIAFGGKTALWVKTANALRARVAIHYTKKGNRNDKINEALSSLATAMTENADDFQLVYNTRNFNPYHQTPALSNGTGNFTIKHSQQLIDAMNGTTYGIWDPRLPIIAGKPTTATLYLGTENGSGTGGNTDLTVNTWHSRISAPILMMTFAEQKFIEAEAEFLKAGGTATSTGSSTAAYNAYIAGINANLTKLGVADTAKTRYLADTKIAVTAAGLKLTHIMTEKWKALFLNPESWTDMRRYDYSPDIYKDLALPRNQNPQLAGAWIRRVLYPQEEFSRNNAQVLKVQKTLNDKVWWDQ